MNDPITLKMVLLTILVFFGSLWVGNILLGLLAWARAASRCPSCDRRLVRRTGPVLAHEERYYCPFHDPRNAA